MFPQSYAIEYTTYNTQAYSITVPIGLEQNFDEEKNTASYENDNVWIDLSHFTGSGAVIDDRDEYLNEMIIPAQQKSCESETFEKDERECTYKLLDSYKTTLHENTVLSAFDQMEFKYSLESEHDDNIRKCYADTVIVDDGVWLLLGCIRITSQQATNPFIGLSGGMALNVLRESMDSFEPRNAYLMTFDELIETMNLKIANFIDHSKTPQYYLDRYNNEPKYKEWFDENYAGITINDAVGFQEIGTSPNILSELGYLDPKISEKENQEQKKEIPSTQEVAVESTELGIASFVDKTKDPQSYVDRYNNEASYKEWFENNFPEYDSIEQAVGLELKQKIPDWVKNIFGWYSQDQVSEDELLNAIKYLINEKILVVD